jgi:3-deoxy-manno-octulosonate cytidylyltransferase (CMP-KDO synthetase)
MRSICVIPARMGSSRYPGKPLAPLLGLPLILHVWHRCRLDEVFDRVVIATCDAEIEQAAIDAGADVVMTADTHERATDRTEEAVENMGLGLANDDFVLMVQGDEVLVNPEMTGVILRNYQDNRPDVVNLASRLYRVEDHDDPNTVKVVSAPNGDALYFSRAPIPSRSRAENPPAYQQTGVIGFSWSFLKYFSDLPQTPLEKIESVDMLRVLEHGFPLKFVFTDIETIGVDTPADLARAEEILRSDAFTSRYLDTASTS